MSRRGQANLAAVAVALLALTTVAGLGIALADGALASAERAPAQRHAADAVADRLVAPDSPTTRRANVLDRSAIRRLSADRVDALAPAAAGRPLRVRLGERTLVSRGDPEGVTLRRIVLVASVSPTTRRVDLDRTRAVTLPRRTDRLRLTVRPAPNATLRTVRVGGRVALHDPGGLSGTAAVDTSRYDTLRLRFEGTGGGTVAVTYYPVRATKATLEVTVGA